MTIPSEPEIGPNTTDQRLSAEAALRHLDAVSMGYFRRAQVLPAAWVDYGTALEAFIAGLPGDGEPRIGPISDLPQPPELES